MTGPWSPAIELEKLRETSQVTEPVDLQLDVDGGWGSQTFLIRGWGVNQTVMALPYREDAPPVALTMELFTPDRHYLDLSPEFSDAIEQIDVAEK
ncbi:MAG: hypothetical protein QM809_13440 [Gordonia sp. (in: high G+C Gram-positive bacteria)]|uniref:hypothetical protein n=1 Tax=Gordonia sp. (in: high G+C Gram-positive bacteria) TaxID=84139 RepID=UPI0039E2D551